MTTVDDSRALLTADDAAGVPPAREADWCRLQPRLRVLLLLFKEMLYPGSRFRMAVELLETYLRQLIESHASVPEVQVAWQGGEPTLTGVDFFRRAVEIAGYLKPGQRAEHTIQTNGTLLDPEWARFFRERGFLVGLSIDGPRLTAALVP